MTGGSITTVPITIVNAQLVYQPQASHFDFAVECRNCTQQVFIISPFNTGGGTLGVIPFAGIRVRYKM